MIRGLESRPDRLEHAYSGHGRNSRTGPHGCQSDAGRGRDDTCVHRPTLGLGRCGDGFNASLLEGKNSHFILVYS